MTVKPILPPVYTEFEDALLTKDPAEVQRLMNAVVVGVWPTGVEASRVKRNEEICAAKDYPELDFSKMNIYLLGNGGERTPGWYEEERLWIRFITLKKS